MSDPSEINPLGSLARMSASDLYIALFQESPIAALEEDWTGPKQAVDAVKRLGVTNFDQFLIDHPDFVFDVRRKHRVVDANAAAMQLFGYTSKSEFLAHSRQLLPANVESNASVLRAFANGARSAQGERLLRTSDGRVVPILWRTVVPPQDGDFSRLLFYAVDVSALRQAEDALSTAQAELARASRIAIMGEMTASIAHEINQPLGAIRIFADSALSWLDRPVPSVERAQRSIAELAASADRAAAIVRRVKDVVRREPPRTHPVALNKAVFDSFALLGREAREAAIALTVNMPPDLPPVQAEPTQLQQVLINLFANAIQAMATDCSANGELAVSACMEAPGRVAIAVEDNGPGFSSGAGGRIFEPFFSTKTEGMGLGLSICRSIIESHGGTIVASARVGGGARFSFTLPAGISV
jgi:C4-dicarboxylate-specific signal transduction histidine kinase